MNRLVILAPNWLGDAVMALPAIADLHARAWSERHARARAGGGRGTRGQGLRYSASPSELHPCGAGLQARRHSGAMGLSNGMARRVAHARDSAGAGSSSG